MPVGTGRVALSFGGLDWCEVRRGDLAPRNCPSGVGPLSAPARTCWEPAVGGRPPAFLLPQTGPRRPPGLGCLRNPQASALWAVLGAWGPPRLPGPSPQV